MSRSTLIALCGVALAAVLVVVGAMRTMASSREELEQQFAQGERLRADEVARSLEEDLNQVGDYLRFLGPLLSSTESLGDCTRELRVLLQVAAEIRSAMVFDEQRAPLLEVVRADASPLPAALRTDVLRWLQRPPRGDRPLIDTSGPMASDEGGWLRAFALTFGDAQARRQGMVVLLVDTSTLSRASGLHAGAPHARALFVDPNGAFTPASDPALARATSHAAGPAFAKLSNAIATHAHGTLEISPREAETLELPPFPAIVAHTVAAPRDAAPWAVVTVRSTSVRRIHERALILRLGLAAAGIALCFVAFAAYLLLMSRRALALRERLRHADALAHLHDKTEKVLDNIPAIVVTLSNEGRVTALNRLARARIAESAVGAPLAAAFPEAPAALLADLEELVTAATRDGEVQSLFGRRIALFGAEGSFSLHAVPLEARFPEARVILVFEDLSQVRALELQLLQAEKLATVGVLAAGIAHEIGTPLSVVRGRAEYIGSKLGDGHPQRAGLDVITGEIERVVRTVRQLLDFSRVRPAQVAPVPLDRIANTVGELLSFEGQRRKVTLTIDVPATLPPLLADSDRLQQVLINLVMNAYDACPAGGAVRLAAALSRSGRRVDIVVCDDGQGIPPALRLQVFDPFFTTKKRGQGTGLGLAICSEIVRDHGAEIELGPAPGGGTEVILHWPIASAPSARGQGAA